MILRFYESSKDPRPSSFALDARVSRGMCWSDVDFRHFNDPYHPLTLLRQREGGNARIVRVQLHHYWKQQLVTLLEKSIASKTGLKRVSFSATVCNMITILPACKSNSCKDNVGHHVNHDVNHAFCVNRTVTKL